MPDKSTVITGTETSSDTIRDNAVGLFRYLRDLADLRAKNVRDVTSYELTFWFSELPCEKECYTPAWNGEETTDEDNWLRIDKPVRPELPGTPADCQHWFDSAKLDDVSSEPKLYDEIVDPKWISSDREDGDDSDSTPPPNLLLSDHPHVFSAWEEYLERKWRPWRTQYQRWEPVQRAYRKLFAIYQEQQRRGEQYELLLGVGVLLWITASEHEVRRPVVTARATISLEHASGRITVAPAVDGANFAVEQDMLEVNERPPTQDQREIEDRILALESPWDREVIAPILKGWLHSLPSQADAAIYDDALDCPEDASHTPQMAFTVLILRRRGVQTIREMLKKLVKITSEGGSIPPGLRKVCGSVDESDGEDGHSSTASIVPEEVLFPLPTNDEQLEIVRRLHGHSGVLVQGPPGTGKSHTIVNLISHLLACGKRILVTSQTPRALKVLRDKIPKDILPLTVSLLGEDAESRQNLEDSVQGILRRVNTTNPAESQQQIASRMRERQSLMARLADLRRRLRETREVERTVFSIPGTPYQGTAQAIAQALSHDAKCFSWLPDQIAEEAEPPLTDDEYGELYALWEQCRDHSLAYALPATDCFAHRRGF